MWQFFKNEGEAFLNDMQSLGEFFMQPVTFGKKKDENLMLRPTITEIEEKAGTGEGDFWKKEWSLFLDDMQTLGEFCLQPVTFGKKKDENLMLRPTMEEIEVKAGFETEGFWKKEWNLFLNDMQTLGEIFIDPKK